MSLRKKTREIERLIGAFEDEARKFHDLSFTTLQVRADSPLVNRRFRQPNHGVILWQYYGPLLPIGSTEQLQKNIETSDLKWGLRGSQLSLFAILEGASCDLFVRMAKRAGSLFNEKEAREVKNRVLNELVEKQAASGLKPASVTNDNPLALWLNYLLYYISELDPGREKAGRIEPDPYSLSLLALEQLTVNPTIGKFDKSLSKLESIKFQVALSFPGEKRSYVAKVSELLQPALGSHSIFYDHDYQSQLARPNVDTLLQSIYRDNTKLIVVFLCSEYSKEEWCGLEWRAIRDVIKTSGSEKIMFVRFDDADIEGVFSIDGYIDGSKFQPEDTAKFILERLALLDAD